MNANFNHSHPTPSGNQGLSTAGSIAYALYLWAIVGGLLPVLLNRYTEGADTYHATLSAFLSHKFLLWVGMGAVFSLLAAHISLPKTLIQALLIGMSAPAFLGGFVANQSIAAQKSVIRILDNGALKEPHDVPAPKAKTAEGATTTLAPDAGAQKRPGISILDIFISPAHAQSASVPLSKHGDTNEAGTLSNILVPQNKDWYVFVASTRDEKAAFEAAKDLQEDGVDARVFLPYGGNPYYGVAVGSKLSPQDAERVLRSAKESINPESYVWKAPRNGEEPRVEPAGEIATQRSVSPGKRH